jgi:hypothetical protein
LADITYCVSVCPFCKQEIKKGYHRFGPTRVICCNCGNVLETGLTPWNNLSAGKKLYYCFLELIIPSWECPVKAFIGNIMIWYFIANLIGFCLYYLFGSKPEQIRLDVLISGTIALFLVPGLRLIILISESNKFSSTNKPPVWRKSSFLRKNNCGD